MIMDDDRQRIRQPWWARAIIHAGTWFLVLLAAVVICGVMTIACYREWALWGR